LFSISAVIHEAGAYRALSLYVPYSQNRAFLKMGNSVDRLSDNYWAFSFYVINRHFLSGGYQSSLYHIHRANHKDGIGSLF
jgi:hypothetical protein